MKAGMAKIDITPSGPVWMDGMIRSHRSTGVHDPLFAKALALSNDDSLNNCFVVVSVQVCGLRTDDSLRARESASQLTGVPVNHIIIAATHTHSGPSTVGHFNTREEKYIAELLEKLTLVIQESVKAMQPVAIGCESGNENTISHYRRLLADDGHVVMNWETWPAEHIIGPLGVVDSEVGVLKIVSADHPETTMGLLFNHAGHPNVMSGDNYLISADYPGLAEKLVAQTVGGEALFINGAQGTMDIDGLKDRDWEGVDRVAKALANAVCKTAKEITPLATASIRGSSASYTVPSRKITDAELAWADNILSQTGENIKPVADGVGDDYKASLYKQLHDQEDKNISVEQICFAIDDSAFISFPGELFTEIGMRIKDESPFRRTYLLGLANGRTGYIPTSKAILEGGYAVDTRKVDAMAEDIIIEQSLALLQKVKKV